MALTTYTIITGPTASELQTKVVAAITGGAQPIGGSFNRAGVMCQAVGTGTYSTGTITGSYTVIIGDGFTDLATKVTAVISGTVQPLGAPVVRGDALIQIMGTVSGGGSYTLPAATTSTLGGVLKSVAVTDIATQTVSGADATTVGTSATTAVNAVGTKLNALLAALRTAGIVS